jgi:single-strand DNA-binding protein
MSDCINRAQLMGTLTSDPDIRVSKTGNTIVTLYLETTDAWTDTLTHQPRLTTHTHRIVIFDEAIADTAKNTLVKSSRVYIEGKIAARKYRDPSGKDRYSIEIQLQTHNGLLRLCGKPSRQIDRASGEQATVLPRPTDSDIAAERSLSNGQYFVEP